MRRIIPAYAGLTGLYHFAWNSAKDHPRLRGVNVCQIVTGEAQAGIIPAYAGLTVYVA